ncbi:MAG: type IV secretion system DNA-binding domain-containing protein, partial [Steroidobacteraceae bacterium]
MLLSGIALQPISAWMVGPPLFLFALAAGRLLRVRPTAREVYRRGAIVRTSRSASHRLRRRGEAAGAAPLSLGGVTIRQEDETKHFKLIGTTGTGKTTAIGVLLR